MSKGGCYTAGEIDSYLDENEAWCLVGWEEGSFSIQMNSGFTEMILDESQTIKL